MDKNQSEHGAEKENSLYCNIQSTLSEEQAL